jgi:hypothetical protein
MTVLKIDPLTWNSLECGATLLTVQQQSGSRGKLLPRLLLHNYIAVNSQCLFSPAAK